MKKMEFLLNCSLAGKFFALNLHCEDEFMNFHQREALEKN